MREAKVRLFSFQELPETLQKKVVERSRDLYVENAEWWDYIFEDATTIGKILGIQIERIYFSRMFSQGGGACFEGTYRYSQHWSSKLAEYAPTDATLHRIGEDLQVAVSRSFYTATAICAHRGHYEHSGCMDVEIECPKGVCAEGELRRTLRNFADWIYRRLVEEYEYLTSDEYVKTFLEEDTDAEYLEDGKLWTYTDLEIKEESCQ